MPARLIYAPKVYAYTKAQNGVTYNLTSYITAGEVQRKINQVSSATITLRNPNKVFTGGGGASRAFHPMDPITIYLERISGAPVRVFTGYLDTTPYYQMYPGTITLQASCTLKRLLYSFFDPSLPYVIAFFTKYGWVNTGSGSIISSSAFSSGGASQASVTSGDKPFTDLQDGSLGNLLWAILYEIGQWQDSNIYIENLPSGANGIASRMQALMQSIDSSQAQAATDFTSFLENVIGASSYGSGGGNTGTGSLTSSGKLTCKGQPLTAGQISIINTALQVGTGLKAPKNALIACMYAAMGESSISVASGGGVWQDLSSPDPSNIQNEANAWFTGQYGFRSGGGIKAASTYSQVWQIANAVEANAVWNNSGGDSYGHQWTGGQAQGIAEATAIVNAFNSGNVSAGTSSASAGASVTQPGATAAPGSSATGNASTTNNSGTTNATNLNANTSGASGVAIAQAQRQAQNSNTFVYDQERPFPLDITTGTNIHIDCSGFVIACYKAAGLGDPSGNNFSGYGNSGQIYAQAKKLSGASEAQPGDVLLWGSAGSAHVNIYVGNGQSVNMGGSGEPKLGSAEGLGPSSEPFQGYFRPSTFASGGASATGTGAGSTTGAAGSVSDTATAQAFVAELDFPSVEDQVTAIALGAEHKGLMHDQSLMPFVQQVAQSSLRSFQSLPNGDFYAFYPDYFGEMGHHDPYWYIHDIEILNGGINLSDDALATHVFAVGDNTWPVNNELLNMLFSAGAINIFNAFVGTGIVDTSATSLAKTDNTAGSALSLASASLTKPSGKTTKQNGGLDPGVLKNANEAVEFIKRYGARPLVQDYPMVRSPIFEMLLAYQQFMFAWSNQFKTPFTFTFMPELFPGGKVAFPEHGIQMYVNSVTHSWNYQEGGFTTDAELSAPGLMSNANSTTFPDLPPFMVQALVEPLRLPAAPSGSVVSSSAQTKAQAVEQVKAAENKIGAAIGALVSGKWWSYQAPATKNPNLNQPPGYVFRK